MTTEKKFPEIKEVEELHLEIGHLRNTVSEKECELRETLLNGIEDILVEMDCPVEIYHSGAVIFEREYWEDEEPDSAYCETITDYCDIDGISFNEDAGVAEVRVDDGDYTFDIRHFNSYDLLEIYKQLKEKYGNNK